MKWKTLSQLIVAGSAAAFLAAFLIVVMPVLFAWSLLIGVFSGVVLTAFAGLALWFAHDFFRVTIRGKQEEIEDIRAARRYKSIAVDQWGHREAYVDLQEWKPLQLADGEVPAPAYHAYSPHVSIGGRSEQKQLPETIIEEVADQLPGMCTLSDVLSGYEPDEENIFLGYLPGSKTAVSTIDGLCHIALAGATGGGKTSFMRMVMAMLLQIGASVLCMNPHYTSFDPKTGEDYTPIEAKLYKPPLIQYNDIEQWMRYITTKELPKRLDRYNHSQYPGTPLFIAIDELPAIVDHVSEFASWMASILREGRKANIFLIVSSQDFLVKTIGLESKGGAVRDCFRTAIYVGGDAQTARNLLDIKGRIEGEEQLGKGVAMIRCDSVKKASFVRLPWTDNDALYRLLGPSRFTEQERRQMVADYRNAKVLDNDSGDFVDEETFLDEQEDDDQGNVYAFPVVRAKKAIPTWQQVAQDFADQQISRRKIQEYYKDQCKISGHEADKMLRKIADEQSRSDGRSVGN